MDLVQWATDFQQLLVQRLQNPTAWLSVRLLLGQIESALTEPDIDGDASFSMTLTELSTAAQFNIGVKIIVLNNEEQGMTYLTFHCSIRQRQNFDALQVW